MVALLVRLKLTLLRNGLRRSVWKTVGLVVGSLYGLGMVALVVAGLVALRWTSDALTGDATVVAFATLTSGWLLLSVLVFGVDETVDPARFALLPVRARELLPGLLAAALVGLPGVGTVLVGLGFVIAWARSVPLTVAAVLALPLGLVTCVLLARVATSALAAVLASRRFRDLALLGVVLLSLVVALGSNLLSQFASTNPDRLREGLAVLAQAAAWSPFGWAWAVPADVARGEWLVAGVHLVLAVGLVAGLWRAWAYALDRRLTSPIEPAGEARPVRASRWVDGAFPATPAGGVAARTLRYWRRDPRYLAGVAGFLIGPIILIVLQIINPNGTGVVAAFAPCLVSLLLGVSLAQDLSYDGSAVWLHVGVGLRGADDRAGRAWSALVVYGPLIAVLLVVGLLASRNWALAAPAIALAIASALASLGVGSVVGTLWQWPAPPAGANPFAGGSQGGLPSLLSFTVSSVATLLVLLPTLALVVWSIFTPWVGGLALAVGLASGLLVLKVGIGWGGRLLERRWPEVLTAVSDRVG